MSDEHHANGAAASSDDDPQIAPITTPVQALRREQLLDALAALLRARALPDDPPQEAEAK